MSIENGAVIGSNYFIGVDNVLNNFRTDYVINGSYMASINDESKPDKSGNSKEATYTGLPTMIYRFKFTEEFMRELYNFAKIHQYDERKDFKEAWKLWTEDNQYIIYEEIRRLSNLGYDGDIIDKMFKSARYYFRKKSTEKTTPRQRRQYISVTHELLNAMDNHIHENIYNEDYQPKTGFVSFCKSNEIIIKETLTKLFEQGIRDSKMIEDKIKKTYKNRYFMLTQNKNK